MWLADETHSYYNFVDMVAAARVAVDILRNVENVDVLVGVFHAGMNEDYDIAKAAAFGIPAPNASSLVAETIGGGPEGFDAIITGHSHKLINDEINTEYSNTDSNTVNGVKFIQAQFWGLALGHLQIKVRGVNGRWQVNEVNAKTYSMADVEEDQEYIATLQDYFDGTQAYASTSVGRATEETTWSSQEGIEEGSD